MDRPTLTQMQIWRDSLRGEYTGLDWEQQEEEDLYFQKFDVTSPGGQFSVKTGSAPEDVDSAVDSIVPDDIMITVKPARAKEKYQKQADKLTRFGMGLLKQWRKRKDPLRSIGSDMAIRRVGIARVLYEPTLWPDVPSHLSDTEDDDGTSPKEDWVAINRRGVPIILEKRNPRYTAWREDDRGNILVVVEHYPTTVLEALSNLGHFPRVVQMLGHRELQEQVYVSDIWFGEWRCLMIEDEPILPTYDDWSSSHRGVIKHGYSKIPYIIAPFRELPFDDPEQKYRGMLSNSADLYPAQSEAVGMYLAMLAWNAWRTYIGWTVDGRTLEIIPGKYLTVDQRKGEYLTMLEGNPVPPEVLMAVSMIDGFIQRNGVAQGPPTAEGTRSAQQLWAIQAVRQRKVEAGRQALIALVGRALELATMILEENVGEKVTLPVPGKNRDGEDLGEVTIGPNDIMGYWDGWDVSFGRRLDPAMLEQAKALMALAANNWMPLKESWRMSGLTDVPQEWEDMLFLQAIDRQPFILALAGLRRVANYYGEDSWEYATYQQALASQQSAMANQPSGAPGVATGGTMQAPSMEGPGAGAALSGGMSPTNPNRISGRTNNTPRAPAGAPPGVTGM